MKHISLICNDERVLKLKHGKWNYTAKEAMKFPLRNIGSDRLVEIVKVDKSGVPNECSMNGVTLAHISMDDNLELKLVNYIHFKDVVYVRTKKQNGVTTAIGARIINSGLDSIVLDTNFQYVTKDLQFASELNNYLIVLVDEEENVKYKIQKRFERKYNDNVLYTFDNNLNQYRRFIKKFTICV